jgi:hypothetical protein
MYSMAAPRELLTVTARYATSMCFLYGWLIDRWMRCAGFAIHRTEEGGFGYELSSWAGIVFITRKNK